MAVLASSSLGVRLLQIQRIGKTAAGASNDSQHLSNFSFRLFLFYSFVLLSPVIWYAYSSSQCSGFSSLRPHTFGFSSYGFTRKKESACRL